MHAVATSPTTATDVLTLVVVATGTHNNNELAVRCYWTHSNNELAVHCYWTISSDRQSSAIPSLLYYVVAMA
jgi:hypothetical protein